MGDEQQTSCKRTTSKAKRISTEHPKIPSRPFVSPVMRRCEHEDKSEQKQRAKRRRFHDDPKEERTSLFQEGTMQSHCSGTGSEDTPTSCQLTDMQLRELQLILKEKQETLRKLNLVRMYRKKNNLQSLQQLINKWRSVSQEGATSLLNSITEGDKPTMSQLLHELQIDQELIHYSTENETFG